MNTDREGGNVPCDRRDLMQNGRQITDIIDFLTDNITAGNIRILCDRPEDLEILPERIIPINMIFQNGQGTPVSAKMAGMT